MTQSMPKNDSGFNEKAQCFASHGETQKTRASGLEILDKGASRSVVGIEHVPAVLEKLPVSTRSLVKEVPSKVGFRFGNNHVAVSFQKLQILLQSGK